MKRRAVVLNTSSVRVSNPVSNDVAAIIRELSEPLAAIVSNAQAGQRMGDGPIDSEVMEVLSDIAKDGKRAGDLLRRLEALLTGGKA